MLKQDKYEYIHGDPCAVNDLHDFQYAVKPV